MSAQIRRLLMAALLVAGLVGLTPAAGADHEVTQYSFECREISPGTVAVSPSGVVHIRGVAVAGRNVSDDPRFQGDFVRRFNVDIHPDGSGVAWGSFNSQSDSFDGAFVGRFRVTFDATSFSGRFIGEGRRAFAGLVSEGVVGPAFDPPVAPCRTVMGVSLVTGVVSVGALP